MLMGLKNLVGGQLPPYLCGEINSQQHQFFSTMSNFKVSSKKTQTNRNQNITEWYVNDILVAVCKTGWDHYCTIKNGRPSLLRDKLRPTKQTDWKYNGLSQLGINNNDRMIFQDDCPDLNWGYTGSVLTKKQIIEIFSKYL